METGVRGPMSSSLVQAYHFYRRPLAYFQECAQRYGDNFTCRIPTFPAPITFVSDPDAIREIFAADSTDLLESGSVGRPIMASVIGEHAMLIIDGAEHRRHRGLIMPYFMRGQFSKFGDTILRLTDRKIAGWPNGARFPIRPKMREITLQVMLNLLFGEERATVGYPARRGARLFRARPQSVGIHSFASEGSRAADAMEIPRSIAQRDLWGHCA